MDFLTRPATYPYVVALACPLSTLTAHGAVFGILLFLEAVFAALLFCLIAVPISEWNLELQFMIKIKHHDGRLVTLLLLTRLSTNHVLAAAAIERCLGAADSAFFVGCKRHLMSDTLVVVPFVETSVWMLPNTALFHQRK